MDLPNNETHEEYRYLHSGMSLSVSWKDALKLLLGSLFPKNWPYVARLGFCCRLVFRKDGSGKVVDIDRDLYSAQVVVTKQTEPPKATSEAVFDYDKLHITGGKR